MPGRWDAAKALQKAKIFQKNIELILGDGGFVEKELSDTELGLTQPEISLKLGMNQAVVSIALRRGAQFARELKSCFWFFKKKGNP